MQPVVVEVGVHEVEPAGIAGRGPPAAVAVLEAAGAGVVEDSSWSSKPIADTIRSRRPSRRGPRAPPRPRRRRGRARARRRHCRSAAKGTPTRRPTAGSERGPAQHRDSCRASCARCSAASAPAGCRDRCRSIAFEGRDARFVEPSRDRVDARGRGSAAGTSRWLYALAQFWSSPTRRNVVARSISTLRNPSDQLGAELLDLLQEGVRLRDGVLIAAREQQLGGLHEADARASRRDGRGALPIPSRCLRRRSCSG